MAIGKRTREIAQRASRRPFVFTGSYSRCARRAIERVWTKCTLRIPRQVRTFLKRAWRDLHGPEQALRQRIDRLETKQRERQRAMSSAESHLQEEALEILHLLQPILGDSKQSQGSAPSFGQDSLFAAAQGKAESDIKGQNKVREEKILEQEKQEAAAAAEATARQLEAAKKTADEEQRLEAAKKAESDAEARRLEVAREAARQEQARRLEAHLASIRAAGHAQAAAVAPAHGEVRTAAASAAPGAGPKEGEAALPPRAAAEEAVRRPALAFSAAVLVAGAGSLKPAGGARGAREADEADPAGGPQGGDAGGSRPRASAKRSAASAAVAPALSAASAAAAPAPEVGALLADIRAAKLRKRGVDTPEASSASRGGGASPDSPTMRAPAKAAEASRRPLLRSAAKATPKAAAKAAAGSRGTTRASLITAAEIAQAAARLGQGKRRGPAAGAEPAGAAARGSSTSSGGGLASAASTTSMLQRALSRKFAQAHPPDSPGSETSGGWSESEPDITPVPKAGRRSMTKRASASAAKRTAASSISPVLETPSKGARRASTRLSAVKSSGKSPGPSRRITRSAMKGRKK